MGIERRRLESIELARIRKDGLNRIRLDRIGFRIEFNGINS